MAESQQSIQGRHRKATSLAEKALYDVFLGESIGVEWGQTTVWGTFHILSGKANTHYKASMNVLSTDVSSPLNQTPLQLE